MRKLKLNKSIKKVISLANLKKKYNVVIMNSSHDKFKKISNKIFNKITYKNSIFFDLSNFFQMNRKRKLIENFYLYKSEKEKYLLLLKLDQFMMDL